MVIKTKKYKLETAKYIKLGLAGVFVKQWWVTLIVLALMAPIFFIPSHWWITGTLIAYALYWLFWTIQFAGLTQLEQGKMLFERLSYEITSQQILIKLNTKQGMPIKWDQVKRVKVGKDYFLIFLSKVQFMHFPHKIFTSPHEIKFLETILKRKGLIKE